MESDEHENYIRPYESAGEYFKFVVVIVSIVGMSILLTYWRGWSARQFLGDFMAIFFIVFAGFKFLNLDMFARTYRTYDPISQQIKAWAYLFPFVEAGLGFAYLLTNKNTSLYLITLIITGIAGWGVWRELLISSKRRRRAHVMCACLGTVIQLPLSKVSFIEDFAMFAMAAVMLVIR